jgi:hypothetical protein
VLGICWEYVGNMLGMCWEKYSIPWGKVWGISAECVDKSEIFNTITCCVEKRVEEPIGMI